MAEASRILPALSTRTRSLAGALGDAWSRVVRAPGTFQRAGSCPPSRVPRSKSDGASANHPL